MYFFSFFLFRQNLDWWSLKEAEQTSRCIGREVLKCRRQSRTSSDVGSFDQPGPACGDECQEGVDGVPDEEQAEAEEEDEDLQEDKNDGEDAERGAERTFCALL